MDRDCRPAAGSRPGSPAPSLGRAAHRLQEVHRERDPRRNAAPADRCQGTRSRSLSRVGQHAGGVRRAGRRRSRRLPGIHGHDCSGNSCRPEPGQRRSHWQIARGPRHRTIASHRLQQHLRAGAVAQAGRRAERENDFRPQATARAARGPDPRVPRSGRRLESARATLRSAAARRGGRGSRHCLPAIGQRRDRRDRRVFHRRRDSPRRPGRAGRRSELLSALRRGVAVPAGCRRALSGTDRSHCANCGQAFGTGDANAQRSGRIARIE